MTLAPEVPMGLTWVDGLVSSETAEPEPLRFLVDSGATYTLLPDVVWRRLGLQPTRAMLAGLGARAV